MKEVFVLGAGASYGSARTPLGRDLVWSYHGDCSPWAKWGDNGKRDPDDLAEEEKQFEDLGIFIKSMENEFPGILEYSRFKQSMQTAYAYSPCISKEYYIDEVMKVLQDKNDTQNIKLIKQLAVKHIAGIASESAALSPYDRFAQNLAGRLASEISVISFNFDSLLHEEFKQNNVYKEVYFDYLLFSSAPEGRKCYNKKNGIPLIKLHGSLDWAFNSKTKEIELLHWFIRPDTYYSNNREIEPYIFLPHQVRGSLTEPLWYRAKEELSQAAKITIIGYSFPAYDQEKVFKLFENVNPRATWEVIDHEENPRHKEKRKIEIQNKYQKWFPRIQELTINVDGFEEYVQLMDQDSVEKEVPLGIRKGRYQSSDMHRNQIN